MRLTEFITPQHVKVPLAATSKDGVIRELIDLLSLPDEDTREKVYHSIMEREKLMSTGIGQGVAMPHGLAPIHCGIIGAFGIPAAPVDFASIDGKPVDLVFLVVAEEAHPGGTLKALARITRLLHRNDFRDALSRCATSEDASKVIADEEARHRI